MEEIISKIECNKIKCKKCGDIIESKTRHDFKWCTCKSVAIDGGHIYLRRIGNNEDIEDLSFIKKTCHLKMYIPPEENNSSTFL